MAKRFGDTWPSHLYTFVGHSIPNPNTFIWNDGYKSLHSSEKIFQNILEVVCVNVCPFTQKNIICEVRYWWMRTPGSQSALKCISKVFCRVGVRAMCRPHGFFHIQYYGAGSVHSHARTEKGLPQTVTTRVVAHKWSKMSLYAVALTIPVTRSTWTL